MNPVAKKKKLAVLMPFSNRNPEKVSLDLIDMDYCLSENNIKSFRIVGVSGDEKIINMIEKLKENIGFFDHVREINFSDKINSDYVLLVSPHMFDCADSVEKREVVGKIANEIKQSKKPIVFLDKNKKLPEKILSNITAKTSEFLRLNNSEIIKKSLKTVGIAAKSSLFRKINTLSFFEFIEYCYENKVDFKNSYIEGLEGYVSDVSHVISKSFNFSKNKEIKYE